MAPLFESVPFKPGDVERAAVIGLHVLRAYPDREELMAYRPGMLCMTLAMFACETSVGRKLSTSLSSATGPMQIISGTRKLLRKAWAAMGRDPDDMPPAAASENLILTERLVEQHFRAFLFTAELEEDGLITRLVERWGIGESDVAWMAAANLSWHTNPGRYPKIILPEPPSVERDLERLFHVRVEAGHHNYRSYMQGKWSQILEAVEPLDRYYEDIFFTEGATVVRDLVTVVFPPGDAPPPRPLRDLHHGGPEDNTARLLRVGQGGPF